MFELPIAVRMLCNKQPQKPPRQTIAVYFTCLESTGSGSPDCGWACLHILGLTSCQRGRPQLGQLRGLGHAPRISHPPAGQPGHALLRGMAEVQERTSRNRHTLCRLGIPFSPPQFIDHNKSSSDTRDKGVDCFFGERSCKITG